MANADKQPAADVKLTAPAADAGLSEGWHLRMVGQLARKTVVGAFIGDSFMAAVLMRHGDWILVPLLWLAVSTGAKLARAVYVRRLERNSTAPIREVVPKLAAWFFLVGVTQCSVLVLAYLQGDRDSLMMVSMIMMAMAGAGVGTSGGIFLAYVAWAVPFAAAIVGVWAAQPGLWDKIFAAIIFTLPLMLALYSRDYSRVLDRQQQLLDSLRIERDRAESAIAAKRQFFAAASHDLRQPLGVLRWYGDAVQTHARALDHEALQAVGGGITRAVDYAEPLVSRYLEIAQFEAGAVSVDWCDLDLAALLRQVVESHRPQAQLAGLRLDLDLHGKDVDLAVHSDLNLLRSVLDNVVGNALKFTSQGHVTVSARRTTTGGKDQIVLTVADSGVGIAPEDLPRVFDDFFQSSRTNPERNRRKGIGLGLAIARRQMQLLGIQHRLESQLGQGTSFELSVPAAVTTASLRRPGGEHGAHTAPGHHDPLAVLVIDDEPEVCSALTSVFEASGWPVRTAASAQEGIGLLRQGFRPDVLVLDYRLQAGVTGYAALQDLRQAGCSAPALFVTGDVDATRLKEMAATSIPVLHKPVRTAELLQTLTELHRNAGVA